MALIGESPRFYGDYTDWQVYSECLEQYFEMIDVAEEKKSAILIMSLTENDNKMLCNLCHPILPKNKTFEELCELMMKHFALNKSIYRERYKFYNAKPTWRDSIDTWFYLVKCLSVDCKFGNRLESILLDRFISGLLPSPILDRLCEENVEELTLQQAVYIAVTKVSSYLGSDEQIDDDKCKRNKLTEHSALEKSSFRERNKFYKAKKMKRESIVIWFERLKKLSINCKFGDHFDSILLDQFISGLRPSSILDRLCEENAEEIMLKQAVDIAVAVESTITYAGDNDDDDDDDKHKGTSGDGRRKRKNRKRRRRKRNNKNAAAKETTNVEDVDGDDDDDNDDDTQEGKSGEL